MPNSKTEQGVRHASPCSSLRGIKGECYGGSKAHEKKNFLSMNKKLLFSFLLFQKVESWEKEAQAPESEEQSTEKETSC